MIDLIGRVIDKVSVVYLELLLPFLIAAGIWVFSHIRIDKQGKRYWFSAKYESRKSQKKLDTIMSETASNKTDLIRLQILQCIDHRPDEIEAIHQLYAEYKSRPEKPNGYIDKRFKKWESAHK